MVPPWRYVIRPVSNLEFLAQIIEKCVLNLYTLLKITSNTLWSFDHQNVNRLLLMDSSAAFDTVDHNVLLDLLQKKLGLRETVLKWFTDYLSNRCFKVCVEGECLDCVNVKFSVPQGSLLGPVLFNSYGSTVIDIILTDLGVHSFANDHSLQKSLKPGMKEEMD